MDFWGVAEGKRGTSVPLSLGTFPESPPNLPSPPPHSFVPCSEKIHLAVTEMASLFPKVQGPERGAGLGGTSGWGRASGRAGVEDLTAT